MSQEYVVAKIKQALDMARGNETKARKQIIAWTFEDTKLLQALTRPHMTGIVAHAVGRVKRIAERGEGVVKPGSVSRSNDEDEAFGMELLKAIAADDAAKFGMDGSGKPMPKRGAASQGHIDALRLMAQKGKSKK